MQLKLQIEDIQSDLLTAIMHIVLSVTGMTLLAHASLICNNRLSK